MDTKKTYINFLSVAKSSLIEQNDNEEDSGYLSFFTPSGIVVGKFTNVEPLDYKAMEELKEKLSQRIVESKSISVCDVAAGIYNNYIEELEKETGTKIVDDNKSIVLEDVTIYMSNSPKITVNLFVIFTDQITGIIPGRLQIQ